MARHHTTTRGPTVDDTSDGDAARRAGAGGRDGAGGVRRTGDGHASRRGERAGSVGAPPPPPWHRPRPRRAAPSAAPASGDPAPSSSASAAPAATREPGRGGPRRQALGDGDPDRRVHRRDVHHRGPRRQAGVHRDDGHLVHQLPPAAGAVHGGLRPDAAGHRGVRRADRRPVRDGRGPRPLPGRPRLHRPLRRGGQGAGHGARGGVRGQRPQPAERAADLRRRRTARWTSRRAPSRSSGSWSGPASDGRARRGLRGGPRERREPVPPAAVPGVPRLPLGQRRVALRAEGHRTSWGSWCCSGC